MIYPGDSYVFTLSITTSTGAAPTITTAPVITIIDIVNNVTSITAQSMTAVSGTSNQLYTYIWNTLGTAISTYIALVSYAHDSITITNQLLEKIKIGDTFVTGRVALDSTVSKDATVSKDSTVAHASDLLAISPNNSTLIQSIKAKTDNLPSDPASTTTLNNILSEISDVRDGQLGTWVVDKTQNPPVLTLYRLNSSILATYTLSSGGTTAARTVQTHP